MCVGIHVNLSCTDLLGLQGLELLNIFFASWLQNTSTGSCAAILVDRVMMLLAMFVCMMDWLRCGGNSRGVLFHSHKAHNHRVSCTCSMIDAYSSAQLLVRLLEAIDFENIKRSPSGVSPNSSASSRHYQREVHQLQHNSAVRHHWTKHRHASGWHSLAQALCIPVSERPCCDSCHKTQLDTVSRKLMAGPAAEAGHASRPEHLVNTPLTRR